MDLTGIFSYDGGLFSIEAPKTAWRLAPWIFATNGRVLVGLTDDGRDAEEAPKKMQAARRYLDDAPESEIAVSLSSLRAFAGQLPAADASCERCGGDGFDDAGETVKCEHCGDFTRHECPSCGGDGRQSQPRRYGRIRGVPLNRVLLAAGLSCVPDQSTVKIGRFYSPAGSDTTALCVTGDGWRVVVMCVRDIGDSAPQFNEVEEAVAAS